MGLAHRRLGSSPVVASLGNPQTLGGRPTGGAATEGQRPARRICPPMAQSFGVRAWWIGNRPRNASVSTLRFAREPAVYISSSTLLAVPRMDF